VVAKLTGHPGGPALRAGGWSSKWLMRRDVGPAVRRREDRGGRDDPAAEPGTL